MKFWTCLALAFTAACGHAAAPTAEGEHASRAADSAAGHNPVVGLKKLDVQVNLIGYENKGPVFNRNYVLPDKRTIQYFVSKGVRVYRLPMLWERLQPEVMGPIDETKAEELDGFLEQAETAGIGIIADLHNYGRRGEVRLGDPGLPTSALGDFWMKFAKRFKGKFVGYDLMNEPHDMPNPTAWPVAAQMAVDDIRTVDTKTMIYVGGDSNWTVGGDWQTYNANLNIHDPAARLLYSHHVYFDKDTSGQYRNAFASDGVQTDIGVRRMKPFVDWLRQKGFKGHVGEFGIPYADSGWYPVLEEFLQYCSENRDVIKGVAYWGAGTWMDFYPLTLQPANDGRWIDRPQLKILLKAH
jgi:aryl-phospho-beta-D-glucosidase BglC (GH1 family)